MSDLIKCKACNQEIAKGVDKCIHCGKDQRNFFKKHKIITGILVLFLIGIINSALKDDTTTPTNTTNNTPVAKQEIEALKISAIDLAKQYVDNEVKADKDYKDKLIEVNGKITEIGVSFGQTYIVLSSGVDFSLTNIQCFFDDKAEIDKISDLNKGDTVTVQGTVDGKSLNVGVVKCKLIK